jgi:hypothetical protein
MRFPEVIVLLWNPSTLCRYSQSSMNRALYETLRTWEDTCKNSTVNVKVMKKMNITCISTYASILVRYKCTSFICKDTQKSNSWQKCEKAKLIFSTHMYKIGVNVEVHRVVIKYASKTHYQHQMNGNNDNDNDNDRNLSSCLFHYKL